MDHRDSPIDDSRIDDAYAAAEAEHLAGRSLTAADADGDDRAVEAALRPRSLD